MKCKDCTNNFCYYRTSNAEQDCHYESYVPDAEVKPAIKEGDGFDWAAFRREAAKDILCSLIHDGRAYVNSETIEDAIRLADDLIAQLQGGGKQ